MLREAIGCVCTCLIAGVLGYNFGLPTFGIWIVMFITGFAWTLTKPTNKN